MASSDNEYLNETNSANVVTLATAMTLIQGSETP